MDKTDKTVNLLIQVKIVLKNIFAISQRKIIFLNQSLNLVDKDSIIQDPNLARSHLTSLIGNKTLYGFPLIRNYHLEGFYLLPNSKSTNHHFMVLFRNYLDNVTHYGFQQNTEQLLVLDPVIIYDLQIFFKVLTLKAVQTFQKKPLVENNQPVAEIPQLTVSNPSRIEKIVESTINYIDKNIDKNLTLNNVAQALYVSPSYLSRIFKKCVHTTFINYINMRKIARAQENLLLTTDSISQISQKTGFAQSSYFTKLFKQKTGLTPLKFRKQYAHIKKIYTLSRNLTWQPNLSVYDISKAYFSQNNIDFMIRNVNGYPYIYAIADLDDLQKNAGWIYLVDCEQPSTPASKISINDKLMIQWLYTDEIF